MSAVSVSESGVRPILADAVDLARRALLELEPSAVGAHLGVIAEDESAATHRFEATLPGYRGWQWAVVVAAPPGADRATVSESALLPGPDALVAPEFVPWEQRVRPGDLAPGDLLAPPADDPRLVPGYVATGDPVVDEVAYEVGLGRTKVMSREGRAEAAERWYSEYGPDSEMAKAAPATCGSCGFYLPLAGSLRAAFGVCGNAMGADGHVVHVAYGCGAHSDTEVPTGNGSPLYEAYDDSAIEVITLRTDEPRDGKREQSEEAPSEDVDRHGAAEQAERAARTGDRGPDAEDADATARAEEAVVTDDIATAENLVPAGKPSVGENAALGANAVAENAASAEDAVAESAASGENAVAESAAPAENAVAESAASGENAVAESAAPAENAVAETAAPAENAVAETEAVAIPADAIGEIEGPALGTGDVNVPAAADSDAVPTGAAESAPVEADTAESAPASDAVAQAHESASSPTPGPEPTATPAGAEDVDAPSGAGVAEGEARPEFQSSPRS
ncbi:DUF3027 domain-containing protein [Nocardia beijingensis]|uniref:DUF3027 domain-containing protein n=1 Tax=Nocardia beijingensis TaxID=95162 RepID=A0ABW7WLX0_9NOCA